MDKYLLSPLFPRSCPPAILLGFWLARQILLSFSVNSHFAPGMDRDLLGRALKATEFYRPDPTLSVDSASDSKSACPILDPSFLVHFPRSLTSRYAGMHARFLRMLPGSNAEGSEARVFAVFGLKFSRPGDSQGPRYMCCARARFRGAHMLRRALRFRFWRRRLQLSSPR